MYRWCVYLLIALLFNSSFISFGRSNKSSSFGENMAISLFRNLGVFGGMNNMFEVSSRVKDGVVNVKAAELKKIIPRDIFFKGVALPVAEFPILFKREGIVEYLVGKGSYVFGSILDDDEKVIRQGTVIAMLNKKDVAWQTDSAVKRKNLAEMSRTYLEKMTKAQENLAKKNIVTSFTLEQAKMKLYSELMNYENTVKRSDELVITGKDANVYSTASGVVTEAYATIGQKVMEQSPAVNVMQMSPILIQISCPVDLLGLVHEKESVLVYPNGSNVPITATFELRQDDPNNIYVHVPNRTVVSSKLTSREKKMPVVYSVFPVKNLVNKEMQAFFMPKDRKKGNILVVPTLALRYDDKEHYVYRIKGFNQLESKEDIPESFQVEKVPVSLGGISTSLSYGIDENELTRSIINNGVLKEGDVLVGHAQERLKDGDMAIKLDSYWEFYPQQEVRVRIPGLTKPGMYVPRKAVIHQDEKENYVYVVRHGLAELKSVYVLGAYEDYCLISGKDLVDGERVIIVDDPVLFTLLYDGRKVSIVETEGAPVFMEKKHAVDFGWSSKETSLKNKNNDFKLRNYNSKSFDGGSSSGRQIPRGIMNQLSEMF